MRPEDDRRRERVNELKAAARRAAPAVRRLRVAIERVQKKKLPVRAARVGAVVPRAPTKPPVPLKRLFVNTPAETKRARAWLCDHPREVLGLTGSLCCKELLLDRDSTVRLFYHSVLPTLLSKRQSSHLLLQLRRRRDGVTESWYQEEQLFSSSFRLQDDVPLDLAIERLRQASSSGRPYALRVVVEGPGSAHALLLLLQGTVAWLVDPNGDFGIVHAYFGSRETLTERLRRHLEKIGCELRVPMLPCLHRPESTSCSAEYCRGGACTFVTGAVALRALAQPGGDPETVLRELAASGPRPASISREVDELVALTLACHAVGPDGGVRQDVRSRVLQLVGG